MHVVKNKATPTRHAYDGCVWWVWLCGHVWWVQLWVIVGVALGNSGCGCCLVGACA